jgi:hypothetical protein
MYLAGAPEQAAELRFENRLLNIHQYIPRMASRGLVSSPSSIFPLLYYTMPFWRRRTAGSAPTKTDYASQGMFATIGEDLFACALEGVGTTMFLLFGLGGIQAASLESQTGAAASGVEKILYIATCMGLSLLVSAWMFFRVTGALFNPNISLALLLVGVITPIRFLLYCFAQMIGAIVASALILALTPGPLAVK